MAIYLQDIVDINLNGGMIHRNFKSVAIGSGDQNANRFGMRVHRDGVPEDLKQECRERLPDELREVLDSFVGSLR